LVLSSVNIVVYDYSAKLRHLMYVERPSLLALYFL